MGRAFENVSSSSPEIAAKPPIVVVDDGDVHFYDSVDQAQRSLVECLIDKAVASYNQHREGLKARKSRWRPYQELDD